MQTIENGELLLSPVPHHWESNGILLWPPDVKQALRNPWLPPGNDWVEYPCVVKRNMISTYFEASKIIKDMSEESETSDTVDIQKGRTRKRTLKGKMLDERNDYNNVIDFLFCLQITARNIYYNLYSLFFS